MDPGTGGRRGAALILGSGLLAGLLAAAVSWLLPVQYMSFCQIRERHDAVPLLQSLDFAPGGAGMRALMAEPNVRLTVASDPGLLRALGFRRTPPTIRDSSATTRSTSPLRRSQIRVRSW
jgi:hypothetical protein